MATGFGWSSTRQICGFFTLNDRYRSHPGRKTTTMSSPNSVHSSRAKVSVVIPCFNEEQTLQQCVKRVLALQSDDLDVEIVIVDDCSRDGSLRIARDLE